MKKNLNLKRIFKGLILTILTIIIGAGTVYAASAPSTLSITHRNVTNPPIKFPETFHVKQTSDGKRVFCMTYSAKPPVTSVSYTKASAYTDPGTNYILEQGAKTTNDTDYFIAQTALWIYLMDTGKMKYSPSVNTFKTTLSKTSNSTATAINNMVTYAKNLKSYDTSAPTIKLSGNITFTLSKDGKTYTSSAITVSSSTSSYNAELTEGPTGTTITKSGNKITINVPASSVTTTAKNIKIKANNTKTVYTSYQYNPSNSSYQVMSATYPETKTASDTISTSIVADKILVSKQDVTTKKELKGAKLEVKNSDGKVVDSWTSGDEAHSISLTPGKYTLKETLQPDGYELSEEEITFEVGIKGITTTVVMYNTPKKKVVSQVSISKQDVTTKEELEGAKLEIIDENGNVVESWTSEKTPHIITGLSAGTYILKETVAPDGYILSEEEVTFTVKEDSSEMVKVVMYNSKQPTEEVEVPSTSSYKTMTSTVIGLTILLAGSVLITRNFKKKHEK